MDTTVQLATVYIVGPGDRKGKSVGSAPGAWLALRGQYQVSGPSQKAKMKRMARVIPCLAI